MNEAVYIALHNSINMLGMKESRTKEEELAYNSFLRHASAFSRFNTLLIGDAINGHLDATDESRLTT